MEAISVNFLHHPHFSGDSRLMHMFFRAGQNEFHQMAKSLYILLPHLKLHVGTQILDFLWLSFKLGI